jgi:glycosyltransferase involved in cell wall biosynthesis
MGAEFEAVAARGQVEGAGALRRLGFAADPVIAVLVPCYNEAVTIAQVVADFRAALPQAKIYVYDNNSTDGTSEVARAAGAIVRVERRQGKGNVVRRMFSEIEADCYIMVDGDATYDAGKAAEVAEMVTRQGYDFVNVARRHSSAEAYRLGHQFGNRMLTGMVRVFFGRETADMLSGYKGFSRRFVKTFPAMSSGFETETELTVHALEMRLPMGEISAHYLERPAGSVSKLNTYRDGARIVRLISRLIKDERPLQFFGLLGILACLMGIGLGTPVVITYLKTGLVPRLPTAVLSVGIIMLGFLSLFAGIILDAIAKARREAKQIAYLAIPALRAE